MAMAAEENNNSRVTTGEIGRRLDRIEHDVINRFDAIDAKLASLDFVHPDVLEAKIQLINAHNLDLVRRTEVLEAENIIRVKDAALNRRLAISAGIAPLLVGLCVVLFTWSIGGFGR